MKNLTLTILLFITIALFSQEKDSKTLIDEMNNFYNRSKIEKLEVLTSEILSGKYGSIDDELKFYALMYSTNVFTSDNYTKKDPQKGYDKAIDLIEFVKTTNYNVPNKDAYLKSMIDFMPEYIKKFPNVQTEKSNRNGTNSQDAISTSSNTENNSFSSDNKTVTLTVSGSGKTIEEARLNALRSAIEQAFGAFISSKTEILNDNLVKDEIVSVSNGNIEKYNIISQTEIPNNGYAMTLSATVSIDKLTSFAQSKGVVVEFKGGMFGLKIKLQKLNEDSEIIAIKNLTSACFDILNSGLDFELQVSEPVRVNATEDEFDVVFSIMTKANSNVDVFNNYFNETIKKISLTDSEILEYKKLNNPLHTIKINNSEYKLRSELSILYIYNFLKSTQFFVNTFKIFSNLETIKFSYSDIYTFNESTIIYAKEYSPYSSGPIKKDETKQFFLNAFYVDNYDYASYMSTDERYWIYLAPEFIKLTKKHDLTKDVMLYDKTYLFKFKRQNTGLIYKTTFNHTTLKFKKRFKLSEINKINEFKLDKIDINEFLKNRNLYMITETNSESPKEINSKSSLVPAK